MLSAAAPAKDCLAVFKSASSDQLVPFQISVFPDSGFPPNIIADVRVPPPPADLLAVVRVLTAEKHVPFHDSVASVAPGFPPPKIKPAVAVPAPVPFEILQYLNY